MTYPDGRSLVVSDRCWGCGLVENYCTSTCRAVVRGRKGIWNVWNQWVSGGLRFLTEALRIATGIECAIEGWKSRSSGVQELTFGVYIWMQNVRGSVFTIDQSRSRDSAYKVVDVNGRLRRMDSSGAGSADGRMSRSSRWSSRMETRRHLCAACLWVFCESAALPQERTGEDAL
jgi:Pyruvate/2-oxoacid:ferredoxin oxidoreductase delta subunit